MSGDKKFCSIGDEEIDKIEQLTTVRSGFSLSGFQQPVIQKRVWQYISNKQQSLGNGTGIISREPSEAASWLYPGETQLFRDIMFWKYIIEKPAIAFTDAEPSKILFFDCPTGEEYYSWEILRQSLFNDLVTNIHITTQLKSSAALIMRKQTVFRKVSSLPALLQNLEKKINVLEYLVQKNNQWYLDTPDKFEPEITICDCINPFPSGSFNTVFCRNRLMYYREPVSKIILSNLFRAIVPGGYFLAGTHDNYVHISEAGFRAENQELGIYKKPA